MVTGLITHPFPAAFPALSHSPTPLLDSRSQLSNRFAFQLFSQDLLMGKHNLTNESVLCIRWPKYWGFSFSISPSNEYSELISFRMDWFDLFAVQGTLKSLLQHRSSKASILWCSAFFIVQLSHPYTTTGKVIALTIRPCYISYYNMSNFI